MNKKTLSMIFKVTANNIILQRSLVTKIRPFSSSSINTNASSNVTQTKTEKTPPSGLKEPQKASSSKLQDFIFAFASRYHTEQGTPYFFSALAGALKQVLTTKGPLAPTSWTWRFKTDTVMYFGEKKPEPKKLDVSTKLSPEGLVIMMELAGFKEDNLKVWVEKNFLLVMGSVEISGDIKRVTEFVEINPGYFFDAKKVTAELVDGYLKVTFPKGTEDTMVAKHFYVKWA